MNLKKEELRSRMLVKRDMIPEAERLEKSQRIMECLFSLDEFKKAKNILFYVSKDSEVFTLEMIGQSLGEKNVFVPLTDRKKFEMLAIQIGSLEELKPGRFGVLEPSVGKTATTPKKLDLVIVPGIAFDGVGQRIGYGLGYYDMFLKKTRARRVGLAYAMQFVDEVPAGKLDEPLDAVITENGVTRFS